MWVRLEAGLPQRGGDDGRSLNNSLWRKENVFPMSQSPLRSTCSGAEEGSGWPLRTCPVSELVFCPGSEPPLSQLVSDSDSELDSTERLALGSTDTLSNGQKADLEAAQRLAKRLYRLDGFRKADVARHLGKK